MQNLPRWLPIVVSNKKVHLFLVYNCKGGGGTGHEERSPGGTLFILMLSVPLILFLYYKFIITIQVQVVRILHAPALLHFGCHFFFLLLPHLHLNEIICLVLLPQQMMTINHVFYPLPPSTSRFCGDCTRFFFPVVKITVVEQFSFIAKRKLRNDRWMGLGGIEVKLSCSRGVN